MDEKEKMLAGKIYDPSDKTLAALRTKAHKLSKQYNDTFDTEEEKRNEIMAELIPQHGTGCYLQGPIYFDYGVFTTMGINCYANFNFTVLDTCPVHIGDNCILWTELYDCDSGTSVSLAGTKHEM